MKPAIIGLTGYAGEGKDTVCRLLREIEPRCRRFAFADALKRDITAGLGCNVAWINDHKHLPEVRSLLQAWGQVQRLRDPKCWIRRVDEEITHRRLCGSDDPHDFIPVITDVRYPNEIEWVKSQGGVIVRVARPGCTPVNDHVSERAWLDFTPDYIIPNTGDLSRLAVQVEAFWEWTEAAGGIA